MKGGRDRRRRSVAVGGDRVGSGDRRVVGAPTRSWGRLQRRRAVMLEAMPQLEVEGRWSMGSIEGERSSAARVMELGMPARVAPGSDRSGSALGVEATVLGPIRAGGGDRGGRGTTAGRRGSRGCRQRGLAAVDVAGGGRGGEREEGERTRGRRVRRLVRVLIWGWV